MWLDNLYVRTTTPRQANLFQFLNIYGEDAQLWMTNVTMQGNGDGQSDCNNCGLQVAVNAAVFAEGASVACPACHCTNLWSFFARVAHLTVPASRHFVSLHAVVQHPCTLQAPVYLP